jgi:hypothetical protein
VGTTWPDLVGHLGRRVARPRSRPARHEQSPRLTEDELATALEVPLTVVDAQTEPVGSSGTRCVSFGAAGLTDGGQAGAVHNDLVRTVGVPGGERCVRTVDAFLAEVQRA